MPFDLKNARATYQRTMTSIFHDMMHKEMENYVDDIVVKSKTKAGHFQVLKWVLERCRMYKLHMNPQKCAFAVSTGKLLGFLVHHRGISVDPAKAIAIATMKRPTTVKKLKSFLGKVSLSCPKPQKIQSMRKTSQSTCRFFLFDNPFHKNHIKYQHQELS